MKRFFQGKKSSTHKDQTHTNGELREYGNVPFADDDIETDDTSVVGPRPLPLRDKAFQNKAVPNRATPSSFCPQNPATVPTEKTETILRINVEDKNVRANRDSGISVTSNTSVELPSLKSDLHIKYHSCMKHPRHEVFTAMVELGVRHMPDNFRQLNWVKLIKLKGVDVVRLTVSRTSDDRPDELGFRGTTSVRFGTGTAFVHKMDNIELCVCEARYDGHRCSGPFLVMTASHVVFDDTEAKATAVDFFYDSTDTSTIVSAWGVRVVSVDVNRNRSIIECRTHDLSLCQRLKDVQKERNELIQKELEEVVGSSQMAVLISHPHGLCKQVSFGHVKDTKLVGEVKTKDGMQVADCLLTYDTPTCPGSGGGPVNVLGGGTVSFAFAPHCASMANGVNMSGLGWARVV